MDWNMSLSTTFWDPRAKNASVMRLYNYHCCSYLNFLLYFMILSKRKVRKRLYWSDSKEFLFSGFSSLSLYCKLCYFHSDCNQLSNFRKANSVKQLFNSLLTIMHGLLFVALNNFVSFCFLYFYSMEVQYRSEDKNFQSLTEYI